jgi:hypothetical protein
MNIKQSGAYCSELRQTKYTAIKTRKNMKDELLDYVILHVMIKTTKSRLG